MLVHSNIVLVSLEAGSTIDYIQVFSCFIEIPLCLHFDPFCEVSVLRLVNLEINIFIDIDIQRKKMKTLY